MKPTRIARYRKTIPWTPAVSKVVLSRALILQPGQWIKLPWLDSPSRFVGITPAGSIWAVHCQGSKTGARMDGGMPRFSAMAKSLKQINARGAQS